MEQTPSRKTDRRTLYTQTVIKEALLELLHEMSFDKVSIASLCRQAEITRPTFYLHYDNLMQVLDSLIDDALGNPPGLISLDTIKKNRAMLSDLSNLRGMDKKLSLSPCQRGASDPKYNVIFADPPLYDYIVERIYRERIENEGALFAEDLGLPQKLAEKLLYFLIHGSFSMNRSFQWKKDKDWYKAHRMVLTFLIGGFEAIKKDAELNQ